MGRFGATARLESEDSFTVIRITSSTKASATTKRLDYVAPSIILMCEEGLRIGNISGSIT